MPHDPSQPQPTRRSRREIREGAAADFQPTEPLTRGAADPAPSDTQPTEPFTRGAADPAPSDTQPTEPLTRGIADPVSDSADPLNADSDLFFADVAARVFAHITSASWDPMAMLDALKLSADEQRIYLSFTNPEAQALAVELGVDGGLAPDTTTQTQLGMYLNDSSVGKLEYHLTTSVAASCDPNARTITTTMSMTNSIPDGITTPYILGLRNPTYGLDRTAMMLDVVFFAPPGAQILQTDPAESRVGEWERTGVEKGNTAVSKTVFVPQGETVTASYTVALPPGDLGPLNLRHTPTANATAVTIDASCDALFAP